MTIRRWHSETSPQTQKKKKVGIQDVQEHREIQCEVWRNDEDHMKGVYCEVRGREARRGENRVIYEARQIRKAERRSPSDLQRQRERVR